MSLLRPGSFFSPLFSELDTFPFGGSSRTGFPSLLAAPSSDYFRNDQMWTGPRIDLHEEENQYVMTAELPGVKKEDIKINVDADRRRLTLEGQLRSEYTSPATPAGETGAAPAKTADAGEQQKEVATKSEGRVGHPLFSERLYGSFSRSFTLPVNANLADDRALKARYQDGVLKLEIPKKGEEATKTRQVTIEAA